MLGYLENVINNDFCSVNIIGKINKVKRSDLILVKQPSFKVN